MYFMAITLSMMNDTPFTGRKEMVGSGGEGRWGEEEEEEEEEKVS
jgi:hypothetical protein